MLVAATVISVFPFFRTFRAMLEFFPCSRQLRHLVVVLHSVSFALGCSECYALSQLYVCMCLCDVSECVCGAVQEMLVVRLHVRACAVQCNVRA